MLFFCFAIVVLCVFMFFKYKNTLIVGQKFTILLCLYNEKLPINISNIAIINQQMLNETGINEQTAKRIMVETHLLVFGNKQRILKLELEPEVESFSFNLKIRFDNKYLMADLHSVDQSSYRIQIYIAKTFIFNKQDYIDDEMKVTMSGFYKPLSGNKNRNFKKEIKIPVRIYPIW